MEILISLIALSFVIFIHELGHLFLAKRSGIGAPEFSIGFGPKLLSKQWGETEYSIRALPLGGFVKLSGMEPGLEDPTAVENSYYNAPFIGRFLTIIGGSSMNIILGFLIFFSLVLFNGTSSPLPEIRDTVADSPAAAAGLMSGDVIKKVNGKTVIDTQMDVVSVMAKNEGQVVVVDVLREGTQQTFEITPRTLAGMDRATIGIMLKTVSQPVGVFQAFGLGAKATGFYIKNVFVSFKLLFLGEVGFKEMAGPIGLVQFASNRLESGIQQFLSIIAIISISLGVVNLLPFPVLDGGHVLFLISEGIRGKRLSKKAETIVYNLSASLLILLMVLILGNDIVNWSDRTEILNNLQKP